jgi:hypothetical protein
MYEYRLGVSKSKFDCPVCYGLELKEFKCDLCGCENSYWDYPKASLKCPACKGSGKPWWKSKRTFMFNRTGIPEWRQNMEGATPEQVLTLQSSEFGMPHKTLEEWKQYYDQPHEKQRMKEYNDQRNKENLDLLSSESLAEDPDTTS